MSRNNSITMVTVPSCFSCFRKLQLECFSQVGWRAKYSGFCGVPVSNSGATTQTLQRRPSFLLYKGFFFIRKDMAFILSIEYNNIVELLFSKVTLHNGSFSEPAEIAA
jgi:hypothetical protein